MVTDFFDHSELLANRYRIQRQIGKGGGSLVYLAQDIKNRNKPVAVKILKSDASEKESSIRRFHQEVQITQQLEHPNIVRIFSSGFTRDGIPYLVCEYVDGGDLSSLLQTFEGKGLPIFRAINIIRFIARGLGHAHQRGVVHRDIKPRNILISSTKMAKIADFGIGRSQTFDLSLTTTGILGTPYYISPEQIESQPITPTSDVYALGILCYEILTGKPPFQAPDVYALIKMHLLNPTPNLTTQGSNIPCWLESIVHKATEKTPENRYKSANEFLEDLEHWYRDDLRRRGMFSRLKFFIRPNGTLCTYLTEKGVSRRYYTPLLVIIVVVLIALATSWMA